MEYTEVFSMAEVRFSLSLLHLLDESEAGRLERIARNCPLATVEETVLAGNEGPSYSNQR